MYTELSGTYIKITNRGEVMLALNRGSPERPAGRYNRVGEDALYLTISEESARVALKKYAADLQFPLCVYELELSACSVVDLRLEANSQFKDFGGKDWRAELESGIEPSSWKISDALRQENEIGLIDPSRKNKQLWHLVLFRWNEPGAPSVSVLNRNRPKEIYKI